MWPIPRANYTWRAAATTITTGAIFPCSSWCTTGIGAERRSENTRLFPPGSRARENTATRITTCSWSQRTARSSQPPRATSPRLAAWTALKASARTLPKLLLRNKPLYRKSTGLAGAFSLRPLTFDLKRRIIIKIQWKDPGSMENKKEKV